MKDEIPEVRQPRWQTVLLVCKSCGKRSSGAKKLKPKKLASLVRQASKQSKTRTRVLMTTCMGLCPKAATAVAAAGGTAMRIVAIRSSRQVDEAVAQLIGAQSPEVS